MDKQKVFCNGCGRELNVEHNILMEDALVVEKDWGYFSKKDLQVHKFTLCEQCYDKMIEKFSIPVEVLDKKEVLN